MAEVVLNYWAIVVAALIQMVLGALWYSPLLFGRQWMKMMNLSADNMKSKTKEAQRGYLLGLVSALLMSYVLAYFIDYTGATTLVGGLQTGFWLWLGFVATVSIGSFLWEGKSFKLYLLNVSYWLVTLLATGALLAIWS